MASYEYHRNQAIAVKDPMGDYGQFLMCFDGDWFTIAEARAAFRRTRDGAKGDEQWLESADQHERIAAELDTLIPRAVAAGELEVRITPKALRPA